MASLEVTVRTKRAVRVWAGKPANARVLLDDKLADLRPGGLDVLLVRVNEEFTGESNFPISQADWNTLAPVAVRDVRDEAQRRRGN
jgi:hypothetical protein